MRLTMQEYYQLNEILDDDNFKLLTLMVLHPEMELKDIQKWFDGCAEKKFRRYNNSLSIEGIRLRMLTINWHLERLRGRNITLSEYLNEQKEKNKEEKEKLNELKNEMWKLWKRYIKQGLESSEAIRAVLKEFDYLISYSSFFSFLKKKYKNASIENIVKRYSKKDFMLIE